MEKIKVFLLLPENKVPRAALVKTVLTSLSEQNVEIDDFATGSAYNMPVYLLGELAECEVAPVVVVADADESGLKIGAIAASESLDLLCDRLEAAENGSSFDIAAEICREKGQMR